MHQRIIWKRWIGCKTFKKIGLGKGLNKGITNFVIKQIALGFVCSKKNSVATFCEYVFYVMTIDKRHIARLPVMVLKSKIKATISHVLVVIRLRKDQIRSDWGKIRSDQTEERCNGLSVLLNPLSLSITHYKYICRS